MQLNLKMLEDKLKKMEAEVVDLREVIRTAISQEVDLDEEEAISFGIETKASGYDTIFLTIAEVTQSELLTDDSLQHKIALSRGIVSHLLRDMVEG